MSTYPQHPNSLQASFHPGSIVSDRISELRVNGETHVIAGESSRRLIDVLRDDLGLTGTKVGCRMGDCGSCTVLVDGVPRLACLTIAALAEDVETIEGLAEETQPLRRNLALHGGYQCGFCTPAQVVTATAIQRAGAPDEPTFRSWMSGVICRCTGSVPIIRAVAHHD